jgi:hypothetical protein
MGSLPPRLAPIAALVGICAACSTPLDRLSFGPTVDEVQSINIQDAVRSPQEVSKLFPIEARYSLTRGSSGFVGPATFSVGSSAPQKATANILVPYAAVRQFLEQLAGIPLKEGYRPTEPAPGGAFPDIRIEVKAAEKSMALITKSPGRELLPWGVEFTGRTYTIESNVPPKAFSTLQPYLKREVLDSLTQTVTARP